MHQWWVTAHLRGSIFQTLATLRRWFLASLRRHSEKLSSMGITVHHDFQTIGDPAKRVKRKTLTNLTMESNVTLVDFWMPPVSLHPASPSEPPAVYAIRSDAIFMPTNPTKQISQEAWHFLPLMVSAGTMSKKNKRVGTKRSKRFSGMLKNEDDISRFPAVLSILGCFRVQGWDILSSFLIDSDHRSTCCP